jgi:cyclopropane fatty-acyl-phospholipid synthase-like methyltransferase
MPLLGIAYICRMGKEWFDTWFDSEYYHVLYKHRNLAEAEVFIANIVQYLGLQKDNRVLDLACGKGRHSLMLNQLGLDVIGADLSENSIGFAQQFQNETLQFFVHDMRGILRTNYFDAVLNCFTSFGYFRHRHHNELTANAMVASAKKGGKIVIDFINSHKGAAALAQNATQFFKEGEIIFNIEKKLENGFFKKQIEVINGNQAPVYFSESVQAFYLQDFIDLFNSAGAELKAHFGNYQLEPFDEVTSARLIMVFEKK